MSASGRAGRYEVGVIDYGDSLQYVVRHKPNCETARYDMCWNICSSRQDTAHGYSTWLKPVRRWLDWPRVTGLLLD